MRSTPGKAVLALLVSATCTAPAETGVITSILDSHESGCSITSSTIETGEPNNDNSSARNPNHAIIDVEWAAEGYLDIQVVIRARGVRTTIRFPRATTGSMS